MIVRPHPTFFEKTFAVHGSIVGMILPKVVFATLTSLVASLVHFHQSTEDPLFAFTPFTALGVAISLFLGFRNNACYERWWEGRKQWGAQVIVTRNLARTCLTFLGDDHTALLISSLGVCHSHLLRGQLRATWLTGHPKPSNPSYPTDAVSEALQHAPEEHGDSLKRAKNPADATLRLAAKLVYSRLAASDIDTIAATAILKDLNDLAAVQGACERLATALVPFPYSLLVHRTIIMYVVLAPFAMAGDLGQYTALFNAIVAYTFFGLDEVARQMEQPFGDEPLCLSMCAICRTIETSVKEALGEEAPPPLAPDRRHCLM